MLGMEGFRSTNIVSIFILGTLALVFVMGMTSPAFAVIVTFSDFSDTTGLTLNGDAIVVIDNNEVPSFGSGDQVLRLVPAENHKSGSVFSTTTVNAADFSTKFQFRITDPGGNKEPRGIGEVGADGFVFVIQSIDDEIGGTGGSMGYEGILTSVGIEFDTWHNPFDPDTNHIGVLIDGSVNTNSQANSVFIPTRFDDGSLQTAWIDYDGTTLRVFIAPDGDDKPDDPVLEHELDIPEIIGQDDAFVGFTAGTGGAFGNHYIVNWTYSDSFNPTGDWKASKTKPTFGIDHTTFIQVVDGGFSFNGISHDITDNFWTPFSEQPIKLGTLNTFTAKVYADKGLKTQEFIFGIPEVGKAQDAEVSVEVWYDTQRNIIDTIVNQKTNVVDADSLTVKHSMNNCSSENNIQCDVTEISIKFLEPLFDKVMAVKAVDLKNRGQLTYLNEGFDISGVSLNPMITKMIPGPEKYEGLIEVTQISKYADIWISKDGREFVMDKSEGFTQINESFARHADTGIMKNRLHSGFAEYKQAEINDAMIILQELCPDCISETFDEINDIFAYDFPISYEKYNDPTTQKTLLVEELKAKQTLDRLFEEWYPNAFY